MPTSDPAPLKTIRQVLLSDSFRALIQNTFASLLTPEMISALESSVDDPVVAQSIVATVQRSQLKFPLRSTPEIERALLNAFGAFPPFSISDLVNAGKPHLLPHCVDQLDAYLRFVEEAELCCDEHTEHVRICPIIARTLPQAYDLFQWESRWARVDLSIERSPVPSDRPAKVFTMPGFEPCHLIASIKTDCSAPNAFQSTSTAIRRTLEMGFRSFKGVRHAVPIVEHVVADMDERMPAMMIGWVTHRIFHNYIAALLSIQSGDWPTHSATRNRLSTSIELLIEADAQSHPAVQLSLCFAAMEALLCNRRDGITAQIANRTAVLVSSDTEERKQITKEAKRLYDFRCRALHGEQLQIDPNAATIVRYLAAAVLFHTIDHLEFLDRSSGNPVIADCYFEMLDSSELANAVMGISYDDSVWQTADLLREYKGL